MKEENHLLFLAHQSNFFKIVEKIIGVVVRFSRNQVEGRCDVTGWNIRESNQFLLFKQKYSSS